MKIGSIIPLTGSALLLFSIFMLASCGGGGYGGGGGGTPPSSAVVVTACTGTIAATINAPGTTSFVSSAVTISINEIVKWTNTSGVAHTVTSTTVPANGMFNASLPIAGTVCLKFTAIGAFNYQCSIHPAMTGLVTVSSVAVPPPASPTVVVTACTGTESATIDAVSNTNFNPATVTITADQIVRWNNATGLPHTVTSTTVPANGTFDAALNSGTSVCLKFTAAGAFNYHCSLHPAMTGLVTVN